ncbi:hypothetical protein [Streptosporangium sp. NPDC000396]|uniref:hypothetical protein n=1 Tax=Streptosporangium sp. NPDC000396 TaxID=3366185 RepID=UPI00367F4661
MLVVPSAWAHTEGGLPVASALSGGRAALVTGELPSTPSGISARTLSPPAAFRPSSGLRDSGSANLESADSAPAEDSSLPFNGIDQRLAFQVMTAVGAVLLWLCLNRLSVARRRRHWKVDKVDLRHRRWEK